MRLVSACVVAGLAAALVPPPSASASRYVERRPFPVVSVSGEGSVTVTPDLAHVSAGVTSEAKTPSEAARLNAEAMTSVIAAVREAGIPEEDVGTSQYSIHPVYSQKPRNEGQQLTGYRVSNMVRVKIRDAAKVGSVLDRLVAGGATNVGGVQFSPSNLDKLKDEARTAAVVDARRKAELFAKAAGAQVGRAISISELEGMPVRPMAMRMEAAPAAAPTPIVVGQETLTVTISVVFELLQQ